MAEAPDIASFWVTTRLRTRSYKPVLRATSAKFGPYVQAAGQALLQWNILYEEMGSIFVSLLRDGYMPQDAAIWSSVTSDRGKRDMLIAAADHQRRWPIEVPEAVIERQAGIAKCIRDLCGLANELEIKRNNIAHAPLWLVNESSEVRADTSLLNARAKALGDRELLSEFRYCRDFAFRLCEFATAIDRALHSPHGPLPRKPPPPSRRDQKKTNKRPQRHGP